MRQKGDLLSQKEKETEEDEKDADQSLSVEDYMKSGIQCSVITAVTVSATFGRILCYSAATKDVFLYSSNGQLIEQSSSGDEVYNVIRLSKSGDYFLCGSAQGILRIKQVPSFETRKKFAAALGTSITSFQLSNDESNVLVGTGNGNVLVYSLPQKAFVNVRIGALGRHGF